jgi:hypothetical protein
LTCITLQGLLPDTAICPYIFTSYVDNMLTSSKQYRAVDAASVRDNLTKPQQQPLHPWGSIPIAETEVIGALLSEDGTLIDETSTCCNADNTVIGIANRKATCAADASAGSSHPSDG